MSGKGKWVEMGEIIGAIPIKMGTLPFLMLVAENGILITSPKREFLKSVIASAIGVSKLLWVRALVKLSKMRGRVSREAKG